MRRIAALSLFPAALLFPLLAPACSSPGPSGPEPTGVAAEAGTACTPELASIQEKIFRRTCAKSGCHAAVKPAAWLDLASAGVEGRLIGAPAATCKGTLVVPGSPEDSFLHQKLTSQSPACGGHMPPGGDLSTAEKACTHRRGGIRKASHEGRHG